MAEIGDVNPLGPTWPTKPVKDQRPRPERRPGQNKKRKEKPTQDDDGKPHVDEYA
jgi:hypothetical protein